VTNGPSIAAALRLAALGITLSADVALSYVFVACTGVWMSVYIYICIYSYQRDAHCMYTHMHADVMHLTNITLSADDAISHVYIYVYIYACVGCSYILCVCVRVLSITLSTYIY